MLRTGVLALVAILLIPLSFAYADGTIELYSDQKTIEATDSILVYGKVTGVTEFIPVNLKVIAPDGELVFSPLLQFDDNGDFKRLIHPPLPSFKQGTYSVFASHDDLADSAKISFTVTGPTLVKDKPVSAPGTGDRIIFPGLEITAEALEGSDTITITGTSVSRETDITFTIYSPQGNLVSVEQITPEDGKFSLVIKTGGPLWKEDGIYTVTANQGIASEFQDSVEVEIVEGRVIPEFGTIAVVILAIAIVSIIVVSTKSRLSITPRL